MWSWLKRELPTLPPWPSRGNERLAGIVPQLVPGSMQYAGCQIGPVVPIGAIAQAGFGQRPDLDGTRFRRHARGFSGIAPAREPRLTSHENYLALQGAAWLKGHRRGAPSRYRRAIAATDRLDGRLATDVVL